MLLINDPSQFKEMPPYLNISNQDELAYYTLALTEYNISDQKSCFHNYSMIECSDCIKISKMLYLDSHIIIVNVMIVAFSISFVVFIFEYYHSIEMYDTVQILLRFIPIHASESNPILKALWYGQNLTKSDVHHLHKHLILRKIKNTGFFGVLYFNEEYETIKTIGNVVDILHYHPTSLWRLSTYIREHSSEKGELIDQFFSEKKNLKTISISLEAFHEVSFTFSNNGKILTLKDDGQHHLINQQNRAIMNSKHFLIPRRTVFENCIICICGNYLFFESNHSIFTSITKINGLKDVFISICQVEHAKEIFELAMNSKVKICFHLNGMICFFQKIKPNSPQNIYGKAYEEAKLMFKLCTQDELVFSTNFGKLLNFPQVILFEHVSFTHDIEIDIHRVRKYHLSE